MEVSDNKVCVGDVNIDANGSQNEAGQSSDGEQADEAKSVEHRSGEGYGAAVESRGPVEDFNSGGHAYHETQERKDHRGIEGDAGDKQVMRPDQKSEDCDGYAGKCNELVSEHSFTRETGDEFADHSHGRQDHDVNGGGRVEPEKVLEQDRVSTQARIKDTEMQGSFRNHQDHGDSDHRCTENHDDAGGIVRPDEEGQAVPGEARRAHAVNGDDEIESGENG